MGFSNLLKDIQGLLDNSPESDMIKVRSKTMQKIDTLKKQLAGLSTECALLCLIQKGAESKCFFWAGQMWTAKQAKDAWERDLLEMTCGRLGVIRFYGGPPKASGWYDGTILSMLCDLILFDENTEGWSTSERLSA